MDWMILASLVGGLLFLVVGGEFLVRGASALAALAGITPLVIGLTVVAFGTSAPELAVSIQAGLNGSSDIAVGNVVGSNIFNVLFILGLCAMVLPLTVAVQLVRREVPVMISVSLIFLVMALDGNISALDGILLFAGIIGYVVWSVISSRRETAFAKAEYAAEFGEAKLAPTRSPLEVAKNFGLLLIGLAVLIIGSGWLVDGAIALARTLGVDDVIIGLTIVAAGTSMPEVATSIIATLRKERDIAIGNVVGSNIFNILGIAGLSAIFTPGGLIVAPTLIAFDLPIMLVVALACLPIFFTGLSIVRWEGLLFLLSYVAYTAFLVLIATQNPALETFRNAMLLVMPLVAGTLGWSVVQALRRRQAAPTTESS
jgi:cation:H+ antiporter